MIVSKTQFMAVAVCYRDEETVAEKLGCSLQDVALLARVCRYRGLKKSREAKQSVGTIIRQISEENGISVEALRGKSRRRDIVLARWECFRQFNDFGWPPTLIANYFETDRKTVHHGLKKRREQLLEIAS